MAKRRMAVRGLLGAAVALRLSCGIGDATKDTIAKDYLTPKLPYCRKGHTAAVIRLPEKLLQTSRGVAEYRMVIFGGKGHDWTASTKKSSMLNDLWALHITNDAFTWQELKTHGDKPVTRWKSAMAGANMSQAAVVFGGDHRQESKYNSNDTWFYFPRQNTWRPLPLAEGSAAPPPPRRAHILLETPRGEIIVHGGKRSGQECLTDVKVLNVSFGAWELSGTRKPSWREGTAFPGDCRWGAAGTVFMTHRHDPRQDPSHDPDEEPGQDSNGRRLEATPLGRKKDKYNLHPRDMSNTRTIMAVFGGRHRLPDKTYEYFDELWFYYVDENRWSLVEPRGSLRPSARDHHSLDYIFDTHSLYLFGGRTSDEKRFESVLSDLWVLKLNEGAEVKGKPWPQPGADAERDLQVGHWRKIEPVSSSPRSRFLHTGVVWYGGMGDGHGALVIFGGEHIKRSGSNPKMNDAWMYSPVLNTWREVSADGCLPGASGLSTQPLMNMRFFEIFAAVVLLFGVTFFCYQQRKARHGYQAVEDEEDF